MKYKRISESRLSHIYIYTHIYIYNKCAGPRINIKKFQKIYNSDKVNRLAKQLLETLSNTCIQKY